MHKHETNFFSVFINPSYLKINFLLPCLKSFYNSENPSDNPLLEACSDLQVSAMTCTLHEENRPMTTNEISNRNYDAAVGTIFRISNSFIEASRNLIIIFSLKPSAHVQTVLI
jgi:hypothetical protein